MQLDLALVYRLLLLIFVFNDSATLRKFFLLFYSDKTIYLVSVWVHFILLAPVSALRINCRHGLVWKDSLLCAETCLEKERS